MAAELPPERRLRNRVSHGERVMPGDREFIPRLEPHGVVKRMRALRELGVVPSGELGAVARRLYPARWPPGAVRYR